MADAAGTWAGVTRREGDAVRTDPPIRNREYPEFLPKANTALMGKALVRFSRCADPEGQIASMW